MGTIEEMKELLEEINEWDDRQRSVGGNFGRYLSLNTGRVFMLKGLIEDKLKQQ